MACEQCIRRNYEELIIILSAWECTIFMNIEVCIPNVCVFSKNKNLPKNGSRYSKNEELAKRGKTHKNE